MQAKNTAFVGEFLLSQHQLGCRIAAAAVPIVYIQQCRERGISTEPQKRLNEWHSCVSFSLLECPDTSSHTPHYCGLRSHSPEPLKDSYVSFYQLGCPPTHPLLLSSTMQLHHCNGVRGEKGLVPTPPPPAALGFLANFWFPSAFKARRSSHFGQNG